MGWHVVLEHGHHEGQKHATGETARIGAAIAFRQRRGEGPPGAIQSVHAEHPQDGPFLGDRRGAPGRSGQLTGKIGRMSTDLLRSTRKSLAAQPHLALESRPPGRPADADPRLEA